MIVAAGILAALHFALSAVGYYPAIDPFLVLVCAIPVIPLILVAAALVLVPRVPLSVRWRVLGIVFPLLYVSIVGTHWPLRLMLAIHKPALARIAHQAQSRGTMAAGHVGIVRFRQARVIHNGNVGFQLTGGAGGGTYLVRCVPNPDRVWYNTNWEIDLGDGWYLVFED